MRKWLRVLLLMGRLRRASRRYLRRYARYGPGAGADPTEIQELYREAGAALARAAMGGRRAGAGAEEA